MIKFKQYLIESPKWTTSTKAHMDNKRIPFTSDSLSRCIKGSFYHSVSSGNIAFKQNTNAAVSAATHPQTDLNVWNDGTWILAITGNVSIGGRSDIMSRPDEMGIRWLDFQDFTPGVINTFFNTREDLYQTVKDNIKNAKTCKDYLKIGRFISNKTINSMFKTIFKKDMIWIRLVHGMNMMNSW